MVIIQHGIVLLNQHNFDCKLVDVVDANDVDRETFSFKPNVVIIEAYWVPPAKFSELKKLHPKVRWIVRNHSKPSFLSQEGTAFAWSMDYIRLGIEIACNSQEGANAFKSLAKSARLDEGLVSYLPNYYPLHEQHDIEFRPHKHRHHLEIGCFGAIRPLKNQVNQALAAIRVADALNLPMNFHMNGERVESGGDPVMKSLIAIFANNPRHTLVFHPWLPHHDFLKIMKKMDVLLQVSYSETFNIVAADAVNENIPVLASSEIDWLDGFIKYRPNPNKISEIAAGVENILLAPQNSVESKLRRQRKSLEAYNEISRKLWIETL